MLNYAPKRKRPTFFFTLRKTEWMRISLHHSWRIKSNLLQKEKKGFPSCLANAGDVGAGFVALASRGKRVRSIAGLFPAMDLRTQDTGHTQHTTRVNSIKCHVSGTILCLTRYEVHNKIHVGSIQKKTRTRCIHENAHHPGRKHKGCLVIPIHVKTPSSYTGTD